MADQEREQADRLKDRKLPDGIADEAPGYTPQNRDDNEQPRDEGGDMAKSRPDHTPQGRADNA